jgi:non-heme Fe2+,alpha-ketoglutarate-dependent halogenase
MSSLKGVGFYQQEGYLPPFSIVNLEKAKEYQTRFNKLEEKLGVYACSQAHKMSSEMIFDGVFGAPFLWDIASNDLLLGVICSLLGPNIILLNNTSLFVKYGNREETKNEIDKYVAWHQDLTYMQMEPPEMITAWYAIDETNIDNGCVNLIPRSHLGGLIQHKMTQDMNNMLNNKQEAIIDYNINQRSISPTMQSGQVLIFSGWLLHGSPPNCSTMRRSGLSMRFVPTYTKCGHPMINKGVLMRGIDDYRNYKLNSPFFNKPGCI